MGKKKSHYEKKKNTGNQRVTAKGKKIKNLGIIELKIKKNTSFPIIKNHKFYNDSEKKSIPFFRRKKSLIHQPDFFIVVFSFFFFFRYRYHVIFRLSRGLPAL